MPTPITPVAQFNRFGGMDFDSRPYLVAQDKWRQLYNMRTLYGLSQVPPKAQKIALTAFEIQSIVNIPNPDTDFGFWFVLDTTESWQVRQSGSIVLDTYNVGTTRWETCVNNGYVYFINDANEVRYSDGATSRDIYDNHIARAKPNGLQLIGNGPFTQQIAWDSEPDGLVEVVGDLGVSFDWTSGEYYRIYLNARIGYFPVGSTINYRLRLNASTIINADGFVVQTTDNYVIVKATNTIVNVPNTASGVMGWVHAIQIPTPMGRYVAVFYDHLVVGAPTYRGRRMLNKVMWSNLYDFTDWLPRAGNEADSYECTFFQRPDSVIDGVTGMQLMKTQTIAGIHEVLLIFTSSCIYSMSYTGLPKVMRVVPLIKDYGNGLLHATASLDDAVVWCDVNHADFFVYRGQGVESIGDGIRTYFFSDLNLDSDLAQRTWSYVDRVNFEVVWVYVSVASSADYDKAIAYNYRNKSWSVRDAANVSAFGKVQRRVKAVSEIAGTNAAQTAVNIKLGRSSEAYTLLWGTGNGRLLREAVAGDTLIGEASVFLETGDLLYESAQKVKEVSAIVINATATAGFTGIVVEVSTRESVDAAVTWTNVGTWTAAITERMLTFPVQSGKVLRYRFSLLAPLAVRGFVFSGFEDNVRRGDAAR